MHPESLPREMKLRGLYAITPDSGDALLDKVEAALRGGLAALQYRNKARQASRRAEARALRSLAGRYNVPFIVNDDVDLAVEVRADGVHLGRDDETLSVARRKMPAGIIGVSCYDSLQRARSAVAGGADYVAFGSVFASATKPAAVRAPLSLFAEGRGLGVPLCAIGGITLENSPPLIEAGADLLAVVSDLFLARDIEVRARGYAKVFA